MKLQWSLGHSTPEDETFINVKLEILHFCCSSYSSPLYLAACFLNNNDHNTANSFSRHFRELGT